MADDLRPLTQVPQHIAAMAAAIRECAGDDDLAFTDTLDGETDTIRAARAAVRMIQSNEALAETAKEMGNRLLARSKDFEDRGQRGRDALQHFLDAIGARSLVLPEATVGLAEPGTPSLVVHGDADATKLDPSLRRTKMEPDKAAIKDALMRGVSVPGYSLSNGKPVLKLRAGRAVPE